MVIFCTFLSTKYEHLGIRLDLTEIDMILRENVWFNENWYDFTRKGMIYREKVWFTEKMYDLPRKLIWFAEKMYDLTRKCMI